METTLTLRKRLGFNEVSLWKQFCARRLHLIHTLSLNLRKASEQDEQVRVLAAELCAEYGFSSSSQADFEKLLIAGIQSVRRNQKRSSRNPPSSSMPPQRTVTYPLSFAADAPRPPVYDPMKRAAESHAQGNGTKSQKRDSEPHAAHHSHHQTSSNTSSHSGHPSQAVSPRQHLPPTPNSVHNDSPSGVVFDATQSAALTASYEQNGALPTKPAMFSSSQISAAAPTIGSSVASRSVASHSVASHNETPMTQSLVVRLDVLRGMITAASATWIESSAPLLAQMSADGVLSTAVAAAAVHAKLDPTQCYEMRDSLMRGALLESLRLALDPRLTTTKLLERIGALAASLVHGPNLLSALQALFVSLAQAAHGSVEDMRYVLKPMALQNGYVVDPGVHQHPVYQYYRQPRPDQVSHPVSSADASFDTTAVASQPLSSHALDRGSSHRDSVVSLTTKQSYSHRNSETGSATAFPPVSSERSWPTAQLPTPASTKSNNADNTTASTNVASGPVLSPLSAPAFGSHLNSVNHSSSLPPRLPVAMSAPTSANPTSLATTSQNTSPAVPTTTASANTASASTASTAGASTAGASASVASHPAVTPTVTSTSATAPPPVSHTTGSPPTAADLSAQNLRSLLSLAPLTSGGYTTAVNQNPFGLPLSINSSTGLPLYPVPPGFMSIPLHMMPYPMQHPHSATPMPPAVQPPFPVSSAAKSSHAVSSNRTPSANINPLPPPSPAPSRTTESRRSSQPPPPAAASANDGILNPGPDRLVKIQYNDRVLQMTYSPMKATPPTISEIIENARQSFAIPASTVVRVKYVQGDKIIESNAELIEAFNDREVQLELLVPPPLLLGMPRPETNAKFTPLAPIFRAST